MLSNLIIKTRFFRSFFRKRLNHLQSYWLHHRKTRSCEDSDEKSVRRTLSIIECSVLNCNVEDLCSYTDVQKVILCRLVADS